MEEPGSHFSSLVSMLRCDADLLLTLTVSNIEI